MNTFFSFPSLLSSLSIIALGKFTLFLVLSTYFVRHFHADYAVCVRKTDTLQV